MAKPDDDVQAHSAGDDDEAPCGIQQGVTFDTSDDVTAHSAEDEEDNPSFCGIQQG